ncbi:DUF6892 domain-containing protein [Microbacterium sp. ZW T5_56]|uniref:DUF6892 domain-containing protein n=1 Tax=Microbacterium sp. ZW T5_56 TaxID=3378081 RepID=UPI0038543FAD
MGLRDLFRRTPSATPGPEGWQDEHVAESASGADPSAAVLAQEQPSAAYAPPVGENASAVRLRSFPLKLAVMQRLMYDEGATLPAFTMPASLHPGAPVEDWFRGYQLPVALVDAVTTLHFSRTSEALRQLDPHWGGQDARFDVEELIDRDLDQLPALVEVSDPDDMLSPSARGALLARGIRIV